MSRDHTVFILGAGFSVPAGVPAMANFLQSAREHYDSPSTSLSPELQSHYDAVFEFRHKAKHCRDTIDLELENIEALFSLVDMAQTLGTADTPSSDSVKHLIAHTVSRLQRTDGLPVRLTVDRGAIAASPFARYWIPRMGDGNYLDLPFYDAAIAIMTGMLNRQPGGARSFVTFNYDTVVEEALFRLDETGPDYKTSRTPWMGTHATRSFRRTVPVLKLHGSSNWAYVGEHGTRAWIYEGYSEFAANYAPILIPPTWKKGEVTGLTAEVWKAAYAAIRDATRICIIGFSMPETDPHFKHLVAAALSENRGLYSLDVVDFGANAALRQRYEDFFAPMKAYRRFRFSEVGLQGFFEQLAFKQLGCGEVITSFNRMY